MFSVPVWTWCLWVEHTSQVQAMGDLNKEGLMRQCVDVALASCKVGCFLLGWACKLCVGRSTGLGGH